MSDLKSAEEMKRITEENKTIEKQGPNAFLKEVVMPAIHKAANKGLDYTSCIADDYWLAEEEYNHPFEDKFYRPFAREVVNLLKIRGYYTQYTYREGNLHFIIYWGN